MNALSNKSCIGIVIVACVVAPLLLHQHAQKQWRAANDISQQQAQSLTTLRAENQRLSNVVAQAAAPTLPPEQLMELLRLRAEFGRLRETVAEVEPLRKANQRLLAAQVAKEKMASVYPATVQASWPKAQLAFAGYTDPMAAMQTSLWAITKRDSQALAESVTPDALKKLTREQWYDHGPADIELAASTKKIADSLDLSSGFSVVRQGRKSTNIATLDIYFEGEGKTRTVTMRKTGNDWKLDALSNVWP